MAVQNSNTFGLTVTSPPKAFAVKQKLKKIYVVNWKIAPNWTFDGSSTEQAPGGSSDCLLKPVFVA